MKEPEFQAACREARRTISSQAIGRLQDAAGAAATTVLKIMVDPKVPPGTRLRAAEIVLEQAAKAGEMEDTRRPRGEAGAAWQAWQQTRLPTFRRSTLLSATSLPAPATEAQIAAPTDTAPRPDEDVIE